MRYRSVIGGCGGSPVHYKGPSGIQRVSGAILGRFKIFRAALGIVTCAFLEFRLVLGALQRGLWGFQGSFCCILGRFNELFDGFIGVTISWRESSN